MKKLFLSAAALVVLFTACSKDDDNTRTSAKKYLLHIISPEDSLEITYDAAYNMKKIGNYSLDNTSNEITELTYENGKLTKKSSSWNGGPMQLVQTFDYNSADKLFRTNFYLSDGGKAHYDSLVYDANGRLITLFELAQGTGGYKPHSKYVYTWDSKGNISREVRIAMSDGVETKDSSFTDYTYDNKVNFGARQPEFFLLGADEPTMGLCANNIIKSVHTTNTNPGYVGTVTEEYTYDEDGYPVTRKEVETESQDGTVVHTYEDFFKYRYIKK